MSKYTKDSGFGQKHFFFDNYIEFGKFLSELLYNFSYDFDKTKNTIFSDKALYDIVVKNTENENSRLLRLRVDINGSEVDNKVIFMNISVTSIDAKKIKLQDFASRCNIYHTNKLDTKNSKTYIVNLDFSELVFLDENNKKIKIYRTDKKFANNDEISSIGLSIARTMFSL